MLELLAAQPCPVTLTAARQPRALPVAELAARAGAAAARWDGAPTLDAALAAHGDGPLLITGSFYLAGEAYAALRGEVGGV